MTEEAFVLRRKTNRNRGKPKKQIMKDNPTPCTYLYAMRVQALGRGTLLAYPTAWAGGRAYKPATKSEENQMTRSSLSCCCCCSAKPTAGPPTWRRQSGHVRRQSASQRSTQSRWKACPQGRLRTSSPSRHADMHTQQYPAADAGWSSCPPQRRRQRSPCSAPAAFAVTTATATPLPPSVPERADESSATTWLTVTASIISLLALAS
jgi:hypothetical protein